MGVLLLIAADRRTRALALAELQEAGYVVTSVPGLLPALRTLAHRRVEPSLILLDVYGNGDATPERVEDLRALAPHVPLILVVGAYDGPMWEPLRERVAALLRRPVTVGELAAAVRRVT